MAVQGWTEGEGAEGTVADLLFEFDGRFGEVDGGGL